VLDVCVGYNTLHNVLRRARAKPVEDTYKDRLHGKRVRSWRLLCEDKTVINISEDPYPHRNGLLTHYEQLFLGVIRRNIINTFRQLSMPVVSLEKHPRYSFSSTRD